MMTRLIPFAITLLTMAACGPDPSSSPEPPSGQAANRESSPAQQAASPRLLQPMSEAEWRANIEDGVGCSLLVDDQLVLLVILGEGSIAKTDGVVRKLSGGDAGFDWRGGRYKTEGLTVDVRRSSGASSEAEVTVVSGSQRDQFQADWGCGS